MNGGGEDADGLRRAIFSIDRKFLNGIQRRVCAINHLGKDSVLCVEMGLLVICDKELRSVSVGSRVGHGHDPATSMLFDIKKKRKA